MLTLPATAKTLEGRLALQSRFQDKKTLSATHFHTLIESTLNKLDDRFYGEWEPGPYPKGAVVYDYDEKEGSDYFFWQAKKDFCSDKRPIQDPDNWDCDTYRIHQELITLQEEVKQLKQIVTLLGLGLAAIIFWWLMIGLYHLLVGFVGGAYG
jgi:hypothetical protein